MAGVMHRVSFRLPRFISHRSLFPSRRSPPDHWPPVCRRACGAFRPRRRPSPRHRIPRLRDAVRPQLHRLQCRFRALPARAALPLPQHRLPDNINRHFQLHHLRCHAVRHCPPHSLAARDASPLPCQHLLHRRKHHGRPISRQRHRCHQRIARERTDDLHFARRYSHVRRLRSAPLYTGINRHRKHVQRRRL